VGPNAVSRDRKFTGVVCKDNDNTVENDSVINVIAEIGKTTQTENEPKIRTEPRHPGIPARTNPPPCATLEEHGPGQDWYSPSHPNPGRATTATRCTTASSRNPHRGALMHTATTPDDYQWPTCAAGPDTGPRSHRLWAEELDRLVCRPCEEKAAKHLAELPALFRRLNDTATLMRGANRGGGTPTGTRTPPIPPRLDVLTLTGPGGVATRLQAIEDSWRQALGWATPPTTDRRTTFPVQRTADGRTHPGQPHRADRVYPNWRTPRPGTAVPRHVTFLTGNLRWACERYESVGQDIDDLRRLHTEATAAIANERRPGRVSIGHCPIPLDDNTVCGADLTATATSHRVHCGSCGTRWETLGEWKRLREQQDAVLRDAAGIAA
jgi:hypothetical protein